MSQTTIALVALAALVALGQWLSQHVVSDLGVLPVHSRRHVLWMHGHGRPIYLGCLLAVVLAAAVQLS